MAAYKYWCKIRDAKPVILFRMNADDGEQVLAMDGWQPAPGAYEDIVDGTFDYRPIGEAAAIEYFPKGFAEG